MSLNTVSWVGVSRETRNENKATATFRIVKYLSRLSRLPAQSGCSTLSNEQTIWECTVTCKMKSSRRNETHLGAHSVVEIIQEIYYGCVSRR